MNPPAAPDRWLVDFVRLSPAAESFALTNKPAAAIISVLSGSTVLSSPASSYGPVAQLGERTVQFYAPKFGDVAQASGGRFASMPPKKSIRACSSAGSASGTVLAIVLYLMREPRGSP